MGATFNTYCKKCMVEAPELGDFGFVGAPTLGPAKKKSGLTPFGVLHDGFAALRMVTAELADFKAFLDEHGRHPLVVASDFGEEDFGGEDEGEDEAPRPKRLKRFRYKGRHADGFYELACTKCAQAFRSASSEPLVPFEEFSPGAKEIERFRANVVKAGDESFYKVGGFPYDDIEAIDEFLRVHKGHPLRARLDRGARRAPAKRPAAPTRPAVEPWTPPAWRPEDHEEYLGPVGAKTRPLLAALHHFDPARRAAACTEVGATGERWALGYLTALRDDPEPVVRAAAARAIGVLRDPRAVRPLGRALLDESEHVRAAARGALKARGTAEEEALREARTLRGPYSVWSAKEPRVKPTQEALEAALRDPENLGPATTETLIRKHREPWARDLIFVLAVSPGWGSRNTAAEALAKIADQRSVPMLLALLADVEPILAASAAKALGRLKLKEAVPELITALARDDRTVAEAAGAALAEIRDPAAFAPLTAALQGPSADVRKAAAQALAALHDARAVGPLADLLGDKRESVREVAASAIGSIGGPTAAAALVKYLKSPEEFDRTRAVWALGAMPPEPTAVDALLESLRDRSDEIRRWAVRALAPVQDPRVERALVGAFRRGNQTVAEAAWRVLIRAGDRAFEKDLVRAIDFECPEDMLRDYLYCGNPRLAKAARDARHGRRLPAAPKQGPGVRWGAGGATS